MENHTPLRFQRNACGESTRRETPHPHGAGSDSERGPGRDRATMHSSIASGTASVTVKRPQGQKRTCAPQQTTFLRDGLRCRKATALNCLDRALHRVGARQVQRVLEGLMRGGRWLPTS